MQKRRARETSRQQEDQDRPVFKARTHCLLKIDGAATLFVTRQMESRMKLRGQGGSYPCQCGSDPLVPNSEDGSFIDNLIYGWSLAFSVTRQTAQTITCVLVVSL